MFKKMMIALVIIVLIGSGMLPVLISAIPVVTESIAILIEAIGNAVDKAQQGQQSG